MPARARSASRASTQRGWISSRRISPAWCALQGLILHLHWAETYGLKLNKLRKTEANLRTVRERLKKILALSDRPLDEPRKLALMDRLALVGSGEAHDVVLQRAAFISNRDTRLPSYFFEN